MALDPTSGFVASSSLQGLGEASLPIFNVERVQLQFAISSDFVAAQVANNVLILALTSGRILRIDLDNPADIDDIDLPKKSSEIGIIRRMFLDPTSSHLLITTTLGEIYYLHNQSRTPKPLSRLKGVVIESVAWNPSLPTASTREILVGASDGNIYEVFIEPSAEFYRREEKYLKSVYKAPSGPITGLWADLIPGHSELRRVLVATNEKLLHFVGKIGRHEGSGSIYTKLFETEAPTPHDVAKISTSSPALLVVSPDPPDATFDNLSSERIFAWLSSQGVFHGRLLTSPTSPDLGTKLFSDAKLFPRNLLPLPERKAVVSIALTQWHILHLVGGRVIAVNRLDQSIVYDQEVLDAGHIVLGFVVDQKKNTFWLFTNQEIFEIVVSDEDRDIWKIMLKDEQFDAALRYARTPTQRDSVATASGDYLVSKGQYLEAAGVYGKSSKPFEQVSLTFIDHGEQDALRKYLLTKLSTLRRSSVMQRVMIASWLIQIFMSKLNSLDDTIIAKTELSNTASPEQSKDQLPNIRTEFQEFVTKYKPDLDRKTTYDIISSHGREEELLFYASSVNDYNYVLSYWVQRERWTETLNVLKKQTKPEIFYKYSSVLMSHVPMELVDILTRQSNINPRNLIPALLNYNKDARVPLSQNQAVRYLLFAINQLLSSDAAVHNTLISIYASHPSKDESALLTYLESQSHQQERRYDADFALRLCIQHKRVQSCVHIYSSMEQYLQAVELALKHDEIDLASIVADRPEDNPTLRKKLWLAVAKKVISQSDGIKTAIEFLKRCELLKIEDLIPFFPDFVIIDDFKEEICTALEDYSHHIDALKKEMDESATTASNIRADIAALDRRYAIVEPGERCYVCLYPLLSRQFFVFPCQHAFHTDCLSGKVLAQAGVARSRQIRELQTEVGKGVTVGRLREKAIAELDALIASSCILCSEFAVKQIGDPFVLPTDNTTEWAL
ncbi:hypothetical protein FGG08_005820 [Glutinoglossum americanum]|uniref:Pep3/Vps18/deep orange domain-containing protein n=1 Tax=Glutinoglossum americanum TaxID=1670608 RepID=A0A9P8KVN3_9PEZI|nr:hypothetical protein FGG08_005820 [Glutinoglossum americanum]